MSTFSNPSLRRFTTTVFGTAGIVSLFAIIFAVAVFNNQSFDFRAKAGRGDVTYAAWDFRKNNENWTSENAMSVANGRLFLKATRIGAKTLSEYPAVLTIGGLSKNLSGIGAKRIEVKAKVYPQINGTQKTIPVTVRYRRSQDATMRTLPSFSLAVDSRYHTGVASFSEIEAFTVTDLELEFPKYYAISIEGIVLKGSIVRATPSPTSMPITMTPTGKPSTMPTATISPTNKPTVGSTPTPTSSAVSYIYHADFETGDFRSLTGNTSWEGPIGAYFGKGVYHKEEVVSSPAIGKYAAALTIGSGPSTAAYLFTYSPVFPPSGKGMYAASYYVPSTITPSDWWNIWQWKSKDTTYDKPIIDLNLIKKDGILQLRMGYVPGGTSKNPTQMTYQSTPVPFPTNTWVTITGYYEAKTDNTGLVRIYQNGTQIFEKTGIMTKPGNQPVLWSVNSYADAISPNPATIYVDEMTIQAL